MAGSRHQAAILDLVGEVLHRQGRIRFTVTTSSMFPEVRSGDEADVVRLRRGEPRPGQVVLFRDEDLGHVMHRVLWRWPLAGAPRWVITKGDAVPGRDPVVPAERVLGTMKHLVRGGRRLRRSRAREWMRWVRSSAGMVAHGVVVRLRRRRRKRPVDAREVQPPRAVDEAGHHL